MLKVEKDEIIKRFVVHHDDECCTAFEVRYYPDGTPKDLHWKLYDKWSDWVPFWKYFDILEALEAQGIVKQSSESNSNG